MRNRVNCDQHYLVNFSWNNSIKCKIGSCGLDFYYEFFRLDEFGQLEGILEKSRYFSYFF